MATTYISKRQALTYDALARRYSVLPSEILHSDINDVAFNLIIANEGSKEEERQTKQAELKQRVQ